MRQRIPLAATKAASRSQAPIACINAPVVEREHVRNSPSRSLILKKIVAAIGARKVTTRPMRNIVLIDNPADADSEGIVAVSLYVLQNVWKTWWKVAMNYLLKV